MENGRGEKEGMRGIEGGEMDRMGEKGRERGQREGEGEIQKVEIEGEIWEREIVKDLGRDRGRVER